MNEQSPVTDGIEPVEINDHLIYFYWGRHLEHEHSDMRLGGGAHAVHRGDSAVMIDTMCLPAQASWVRRFLTEHYGIRHFRAVNTHWHLDHISGNPVFSDGGLYAHRRTRELIVENRQSLEDGSPGHPGFPVAVPDVTFEERLDLWLEDLKIELHHFDIHEEGHVAVYLPASGVLVAGDMLEDPVWVLRFDFASPERQLDEYRRMLALGASRYVSTHCHVETVKRGGYDDSFVHHSIRYLERMLAAVDEPDFEAQPVEKFVGDAFERDELHWWPPYAAVHEHNLAKVKQWTAAAR